MDWGIRKYKLSIFVGLLLLLHVLLAYTSMLQKSMTVDENAHLFLGYSFSEQQDYRQGPGMGNWGQRWAALPLLFDAKIQYPLITMESFSWLKSGDYAVDFVFNAGNDPHRLSMLGRSMIIVASVLAALTVFYWVYILSGKIAALVALAIYCLSPTVLAHSQLVTADLFVSFFSLLSIGTFWWLLHTVRISSLVCSSIAISGMLLTKFTGLIGLLALLLMLVTKLMVGRPLKIVFGNSPILVFTRGQQLMALLCVLVIQVAIVYALIWGSYGFRYESYNSNGAPVYQSEENWERQLSGTGSLEPVIQTFREWRALPEAYLYGLALNLNYSTGKRIAFLDGSYSMEGFRRYFPLTFWYKTSLAILVLTVAVPLLLLLKLAREKNLVGGGSREISNVLYQLVPLTVFFTVYAWVAVQSHVNIGHRHILPLYPVLIVCIGLLMPLVLSYGRIAKISVGGALFILLAESLVAWPNYLSYFNVIAGGPSGGYKHLTDSSVDWGQDLPALRRWLDNKGLNGNKNVFLAYYGTSPVEAYGIHVVEVAAIAHPVESLPLELTPGTFILSATMLQRPYGLFPGKWNPVYEDAYQKMRHRVGETILTARRVNYDQETLFTDYSAARFARLVSFLREREPDERIGNSLLVYTLDQKLLDEALVSKQVELHPNHGIRGLDAFPISARMIANP